MIWSARFRMAPLLAVTLLCTNCAQRGVTGVPLSNELQKLIPSDTTSLAGLDLDRLKLTAFGRRHSGEMHFAALDLLSDQIGFDPRRDLATLLVCWNGKEFLSAANGRFDKREIERRLATRAGAENYAGASIFEFGRTAFAVLSPTVSVAGPNLVVKRAIDGKSGRLPDELAGALAWLPGASQIWCASRGNLPFADLPMRSDYASVLANFRGYVRRAAVDLTVESGWSLKGRVECVSEQGAKRVYDALRAGIGLGRLSVKDNDPQALRIYDALHVREETPVVYLDADLPPELADALFSQLTKVAFRVSTSRLH